ncbi:L-fucose/L-arabinose isomerase family protein [Ovoidimarina sediminis]|uniref:L-fucose/L-arabinose isomerase family protein n=1 Tax=Ovoidimarina sediminis TaxID=3079856 RepID=UPI00290A43C1|nr:hypothetical protein [Rhodophyticola sp. MJ-SS7]MDU8942094.1 hypothetical protein [Rhodophyticola sp. MJ-SS7]
MKLGLLPLGRPTFDMVFAQQKLDAMLAHIDTTCHETAGPRTLLLDDDSARAAMDELKAAQPDKILILQVSFTDARITCDVAATFDQPLLIWSTPEPRTGDRLRLNSFCGLNLASHALSLRDRSFGWLYADPEGSVGAALEDLIGGARTVKPIEPARPPIATSEGQRIAKTLSGQRIARIGAHPAGFDTCAYDKGALQMLAGVEVDEMELPPLFDAARSASAEASTRLREALAPWIIGLDTVDQEELDRSLRLKLALDGLADGKGYDAFAIRCWPEAFTEYGGAVCGPAAMMGEARRPCACEADVYGALTQLALLAAADAPVFLTDLVDMDAEDDTGVVWHCGQAPASMCDPSIEPVATLHSNRKMPLLYQFPLKPGPITLLRVSQAFGQPRMVLGRAEMLKRPLSFSGTSGVLRFERPVRDVLEKLIGCGLEHHLALAYGDHRAALRGLAGTLDLPIVEL